MRRLLALLACSLLHAQSTRYDLVISHASIVDGTGNPSYVADIGIRGDTIATIGDLSAASAVERIDARGMTAAPGFIDIHSHARTNIEEVPTAENYLRQGVATIVEGPDGSSPLPIRSFLEKITQLHTSVNFATFVGHGSLREQVMGLVNRKATAEEIAKMSALAEEAMRDGAFGLSTGLFYVPGNFAATEEVVEIAKAVGKLGGIHISHMRDEGDGIATSVRETIRIGEEGGLPTQVTHHKPMGKANFGRSVETLKLIADARARGVDVTIDQYPYTASSTGLNALLPQWALEGGQKAMQERINAPEQHARIKVEVVKAILEDRAAGDAKNVQIARCPFDDSLAGKNLAEITRDRGFEPTPENAAETAFALLLQGACSAVYHAISEEDVVRIMQSPYTMIGSDGGIPIFGKDSPHPRAYGTFARVLGVYVRERHVLTLEDAVRKMTSYPAQRLGLFDRGVLRPGMKADIAIFDAQTIVDKATFERPHQYAEGVRDLVVNGKFALRNGRVAEDRPGGVLYGPSRRN